MTFPLSAPVFEVPSGSPSGMRAAADALGAIALGLNDSMHMLSGAAGAVPGWEGAARDAYYAKVNERLEGIHGAQAAVSAAARVASQLATVLDETHRAVYDAQQEAYRLAQQANTMPFPSPTIFWPLESYVRSASDRLDEAKRAAAAAFLDIFHAAPGYVPPPPPPKKKPKKHGFWSSVGHGVLDVAGLVPVIGEPADLINATWYAGEGDAVNAALSAASAVPLLGYGASATKAAKYADAAYDATRTADKVRDGGRIADDVAGSGLKGGGVGRAQGPGDGGLGNNSRPPQLGDNGPGPGGGGGGGTGGRPQSRTEYDPNPAGGGRSPEERYRDAANAAGGGSVGGGVTRGGGGARAGGGTASRGGSGGDGVVRGGGPGAGGAAGGGRVPGRVQSRINLREGDSKAGIEHTWLGHGGVDRPGKSQFTISLDRFKELAQTPAVVHAPARPLPSGNFVREVHIPGQPIGRLPQNQGGQPTNVLTIVTDAQGNLVTAMPGTLARGGHL